ncbi:MAG: hypothetical protein AAF611_21150 [Bacteroidota bacterium]
MKKINLKEFQSEQLTIEERMRTRAGSGQTSSRRTSTISSGPDMDQRPHDKDC